MAGRLSLLGAGRQTAWTPLSVSGLNFWMDFSDADTMFTDAGTTKVTTNDDKVYQVNDKSGNNNTAIQTTEANRPLYKTNALNGLSVLNFDGTSSWLQISVSTAQTPITVFLAAYRTYLTYGAYLGQQADNFPLLRNWGAKIEVYVSSGTAINSSLWGNSSGHVVLSVTHASDGGRLELFNKTTSYSSNDTVSGFYGNFEKIGCTTNANQKSTGNMYEILIYNSVLSQADRETVATYLMTKWGIS